MADYMEVPASTYRHLYAIALQVALAHPDRIELFGPDRESDWADVWHRALDGHTVFIVPNGAAPDVCVLLAKLREAHHDAENL